MKRFVIVLMIIFSVALIVNSNALARGKRVIRANGGAPIAPIGIIIDASYDPRLDTLVEGYKVINVVLSNQSFSIIYLDPQRDVWSVKLAGKSKAIKAIHNLRNQDPKSWSKLPEGAKKLVGYPLVLPVGAQDVFDLFVPASADLESFNELQAYIKSLNMRFDVLVSQ